MAKMTPTPEQQSVIDHRGGALLVSAAAGSGKTKVLVDRLLRQVCDPVRPCNVDDFLIITFTQAAAMELREKIAKKISERLAEEPTNRHLRRQLTRLYMAQISTVHSFCTELLREHAYLLNIPADFRVGDETECAAMQEQVLSDLLEGIYDEVAASPTLSAFFDGLGYGRDDRRAAGLIMEVYRVVQSQAWPEAWLQTCRDCLSDRAVSHISETPWGAWLLEDTKRFLVTQKALLRDAALQLESAGNLVKYLPAIESDLALVNALLEDLSWENLGRAAATSFMGLPPVRNCDDPVLQEKIKNIRGRFKEQLTSNLQPFAQPADEALAELMDSHDALLGLTELVLRFTRAYGKKKRQRRILDFNDLEHDAIRLLADPYTGLPTSAAKTLSGRFREIMVDEYQDTNEVQDTIFRAISQNGENLFMVGDVKQSIYRFRLADPGIFLKKYKEYQVRENSLEITPRKILLSANFRSRPEIIEAVNHVFTTVMSEAVGDIAYTEAEQLRTIREFPSMDEPMVELHCISTKSDEGEDTEQKTVAEARFVAARIRELIEGEHYITDGEGVRRIRPEDVAILLRSMSQTGAVYARALAEEGLSVVTEKSEDAFASTEISTLLAWLKIVDNPHRDIPLTTVLTSPVGNFSADEMARIRSVDRWTDLYDALRRAGETDPKAAAFLALLRELRQQRPLMELDEFVEHLTRRTDIFGVFSVMADGRRRVRNLRGFCDLCTDAAAIGIRSLSGFLRYVDSLRRQGRGLQTGPGEGSGVTLMTVHKSKGLEFPVVFLANLSGQFNRDDQKAAVRMDPQLLIGGNIVDRARMATYPSAAKFAISRKKQREALSEEMRLLYVAMTRAKDRLIMTYCGKHAEKHLRDAACSAAYPAEPTVAEDVSSMGQWVLLAAAVRPEGRQVFEAARRMTETPAYPWLIRYHNAAQEPVEILGVGEKTAAVADLQPVGRCLTDITSGAVRVPVPAKLTATQLKGRQKDVESAENAEDTVTVARPQIRPRPFAPAGKPLTAAQKGTAMHLFMQYCDYGSCRTEEGLVQERERLERLRFLTSEQCASLDLSKISAFFASPWGELVTCGADVRREFKFSLLVEASHFFDDAEGEMVMLQGVVDCFVITQDGIVVFDYKTDRVAPGGEADKVRDYQPQLRAYSYALERIFGLPVIRRIVYFFATGTACEV